MIDFNRFLISIVVGILITWFLSGIIAHADTCIYLVDLKNFPQDRYWSGGSETSKTFTNFIDVGLKNSKQPFEITRFEKNYNKKYALLNITYTDAEKKSFSSMNEQKYIKLLSINAVDYIFDRQKGGYVLSPRNKVFEKLPDDWFETVISTESRMILGN